MAEALDKVKGSLVSGYAAKSGRTPEEVSALMGAETWFDASDAVAQGFADRLIEPVRIAARFDIGRFRNAPPVLVKAIEADPEPDDESNDANNNATDGATEGDEVADAEDEPAAVSGRPAVADREAGAQWRTAGPCRDPDRGHWPRPRSGRSLSPRRSAADGRPFPRRGREPRRGARRASSPQRPRRSPRSRPITRSPAAPRPRAPGARSSPAPSS